MIFRSGTREAVVGPHRSSSGKLPGTCCSHIPVCDQQPCPVLFMQAAGESSWSSAHAKLGWARLVPCTDQVPLVLCCSFALALHHCKTVPRPYAGTPHRDFNASMPQVRHTFTKISQAVPEPRGSVLCSAHAWHRYPSHPMTPGGRGDCLDHPEIPEAPVRHASPS